jgi:hypothetical protein
LRVGSTLDEVQLMPLAKPHAWLPLGILVGLLGSGVVHADDAVEYNRDVRPILAENCFQCHGPDSAARKADLRLDQRDAALRAGAIVAGKPDESELIFRIEEEDATVHMPPPTSGKHLTDAQKSTLRRWVEQGAEYQPLWSFLPPKRSEPPSVRDESWVRNPIDRFVLAELERRGLSPAPEADRRTLARRLSLDLTGLPPEPELVEAFVHDASEQAYERLVDRLLASPAWGEHRAHYWLDAARYGDTNGIHFDNFREIWSYRQWVIEAFNRNLPFDQFTVEQLAGDLLPEPTLDQKIATGFNRCNITTNEGGTIPEEYLVLYTRDRTETVSHVWLGLTANCAVCHDHKFDPLTQRQFYEMAAFFNNTTQAAMDGNIKDTPPIVFVPPQGERERWDTLLADLGRTRGELEARRGTARADFETWLNGSTPDSLGSSIPSEGLKLHASLSARAGDATAAGPNPPTLEIADAGDFEKDQPFGYGAWVRLPRGGMTGAVVARMDDGHDYRGWDLWIENGRPGAHIVSKWQDDALKVVANTELKPGEWSHVYVAYDGSGKAAGVTVFINGVAQPTTPQADQLQGSIRTEVPLKVGQRHSTARLEGAEVHGLRLFGRALPADEVAGLVGGSLALDLLAMPAEKRPAADLDTLFDWWLGRFDEPTKALRGTLAGLQALEAAIRARGTVAHVMQEKAEEPVAFVLERGDYDKRRDEVKADTPDFLPPMPSDLPRNRLGFARWLVSPENPLTARVTVNRMWQEVFGTGIVRTSGDFGTTGEPPSHPELLDWLAIDFRESGWDVKRFYKQIVMSSTYRQAAISTPEKRERDPDDRWISRGPRFRMDAEMVRDYALAASGLLVERLGGPSVKPYQPEGVWEAVAMPESNTRYYKRDGGDSLYRRSLYTLWKRAAPPAMLEIFNAPNREYCTVRRERTDTPLQALVTLNDPQFVEAARSLAALALKAGDSDEARLDRIAHRLLARPFRDEEVAVVRESLDGLAAHFLQHPEDAKALLAVGDSEADESLDPTTLAAWTMLCNELMNLDEVLNK